MARSALIERAPPWAARAETPAVTSPVAGAAYRRDSSALGLEDLRSACVTTTSCKDSLGDEGAMDSILGGGTVAGAGAAASEDALSATGTVTFEDALLAAGAAAGTLLTSVAGRLS